MSPGGLRSTGTGFRRLAAGADDERAAVGDTVGDAVGEVLVEREALAGPPEGEVEPLHAPSVNAATQIAGARTKVVTLEMHMHNSVASIAKRLAVCLCQEVIGFNEKYVCHEYKNYTNCSCWLGRNVVANPLCF